VPWFNYTVNVSNIVPGMGYLSWGMGDAGDKFQLTVYNITTYLNCNFQKCIEVDNFACVCNNCSLEGNISITIPQSWNSGIFGVSGLVTVQNQLVISDSQFSIQDMILTNGSTLILDSTLGTIYGNLNMSALSVITLNDLNNPTTPVVQVNGCIQFGGTLVLNANCSMTCTLFSYNCFIGNFSQVVLVPNSGMVNPVLTYGKNTLTVNFYPILTNTPTPFALIEGLCAAGFGLLVVVVSGIYWGRWVAREKREVKALRLNPGLKGEERI